MASLPPRHAFCSKTLLQSSRVGLSDRVGPVCLPQPGENFDDFKNCVSSGWGKNQFGPVGKFSDVLKKINLNNIPHGECNERFKKPFKGRFTVDKSQLCVGGEEGKDTCTGDGGSPHVCVQNEKFVQVVN